jgi:hypothetical protein
MYSENALKTASFRLRRFRNQLKNHELAPPQAQKCNNCFACFRLLDQKPKSGNHHGINNITNPQGRTKNKRRAKPKCRNSRRKWPVELDKDEGKHPEINNITTLHRQTKGETQVRDSACLASQFCDAGVASFIGIEFQMRWPCPIATPQYFCILGSISSAQARMPPARLTTRG